MKANLPQEPIYQKLTPGPTNIVATFRNPKLAQWKINNQQSHIRIRKFQNTNFIYKINMIGRPAFSTERIYLPSKSQSTTATVCFFQPSNDTSVIELHRRSIVLHSYYQTAHTDIMGTRQKHLLMQRLDAGRLASVVSWCQSTIREPWFNRSTSRKLLVDWCVVG
jgi:hypothetical protein